MNFHNHLPCSPNSPSNSNPIWNPNLSSPKNTLRTPHSALTEALAQVITIPYLFPMTRPILTFSLLILLFLCLASRPAWSQPALLGLTAQGGIADEGNLFVFTPQDSSLTHLEDFSPTGVIAPFHGATLTSTGRVFGTLSDGGSFGAGGIFEYFLLGDSVQIIHEFSGGDGQGPRGKILEAANGKLYGATEGGGANGLGTLFEFEPGVGLTTLHSFSNGTGSAPFAGTLIEVAPGRLFGLTRSGGNGGGVIFEYDLNQSLYTVHHNFSNADGIGPRDGLLQASNGLLYGLTYEGGSNSLGTIFSYDTAGIFTKLIDLTNSTGGAASGSFIQAGNGKLYALTSTRGNSNVGTLIEFDITSGVITTHHAFNGVDGENPLGTLVEFSNGLLYGLTSGGGDIGGGTVFAFDPLTNVLGKVGDFFGFDGLAPQLTPLLEVCLAPAFDTWTDDTLLCAGDDLALHFDLRAEDSVVWTINGISIVNSNNDSLFLTNLNKADSGLYQMVAYNVCGSAISQSIHVAVSDPDVSLSLSQGISCFGANDATIVATGMGGLGTLQYSADNMIYQASDTFAGLMPGPLYLYVQDSLGCVDSGFYVIHEPSLLVVSADSSADLSCAGAANGFASVSVSGGTLNYQFSWPLGDTTSSVNNLMAGTTQVIVTDANGCSDSITFSLSEPSALSITASITIETSPGNGGIDITVSGGTGPYTYDWDVDGNGDFDDDEDLTGVVAGSYQVIVMDANGCTDTLNYTVNSVIGLADMSTDAVWQCFPNPVHGALVITGGKAGDQYQLLDLSGRVIAVGPLIGERTTLDLSSEAPGSYLLRLEGRETIQIVRLIKP